MAILQIQLPVIPCPFSIHALGIIPYYGPEAMRIFEGVDGETFGRKKLIIPEDCETFEFLGVAHPLAERHLIHVLSGIAIIVQRQVTGTKDFQKLKPDIQLPRSVWPIFINGEAKTEGAHQ